MKLSNSTAVSESLAPRRAGLNLIGSLVLVVEAWALLTSPQAQADGPGPDPARPSVSRETDIPSHDPAHHPTSRPVPDCPHCRKPVLLAQATEVSGAAKGRTATKKPTTVSARALRDRNLGQAQNLATQTPPIATIPEIPTASSDSTIPMIPTDELAAPTIRSEYPNIEDALIFQERTAPIHPSLRPQRVPNTGLAPSGTELDPANSTAPAPLPAESPLPLSLSAKHSIPSTANTNDPRLPELPADLRSPATEEPKLPALPDDLRSPSTEEPRLPALPDDLKSPTTEEPKLPELPDDLKGSDATPEIFPRATAPASTATLTPRAPAIASPTPTPPPVRSPAPAVVGAAVEQGPSARIVATTPLRPTLAMPPPAARGTWNDANAHARASVETDRDMPAPLNGYSMLPVMIGDQSPASLLTGMPVRTRQLPGQPPSPPSPFARTNQAAALVPWARGFKIADNQSPMPQDRLFYSFHYFDDMNGDINRRIGSPITEMQVYRQLLGIEKTIWKGNASVGLRLPIDTLWTSSSDPTLRHNSTSVGDLTLFTKFLLYDNPAVGSLLSGGLAVTAPTGPASFAGSSAAFGFRNTQIQPYLGYILRRGDFYLQGFSAIDIPTDSRDVTMWYNDLALGYFLYQSADPSAFLSAVVPTFELHLNDPLNHRGALRPNDPAGTPDVLDLTFGSSFILHKRLVATFGCSFPVTGPRPFDVEAIALLNFYYGRYGMAQPWPMPPANP